jgi:hypothetical protein
MTRPVSRFAETGPRRVIAAVPKAGLRLAAIRPDGPA